MTAGGSRGENCSPLMPVMFGAGWSDSGGLEQVSGRWQTRRGGMRTGRRQDCLAHWILWNKPLLSFYSPVPYVLVLKERQGHQFCYPAGGLTFHTGVKMRLEK